MTSQDKDKSQIKIDIGAKAGLEAKISTEVPSASSGRFVDAITDIFRPFSEKRGLKADQIRLQREDILIEIARKARLRLKIENEEPQEIKNKFLIPFLEKASIEEPGSPLIDLWTSLLVSSAINPEHAHPRFVQILSELTSQDANLLQRIGTNFAQECQFPGRDLCNCPYDLEQSTVFEEMSEWLQTTQPDRDTIFNHFCAIIDRPGATIIDIIIIDRENPRTEMWSMNFLEDKERINLGDSSLSSGVLHSLNLLKEASFKINYKQYDITVIYTHITAIGVEFLLACDSQIREQCTRETSETSAIVKQ